MADADPFAKWADPAAGSAVGGDSPPPAAQAPEHPKMPLGSLLSIPTPGGIAKGMAKTAQDFTGDPSQVHQVVREATLGFVNDADVVAEKARIALENVHRHKQGQPPLPIPTDQEIRAQLKTMEQTEQAQHPHRSAIEQFAGALMTPGIGEANALLKGATKIPGIVRAGIIGADVGGLSAAGHAEGTAKERLAKAPEGAVVGSVLGEAMHVAPEIGGRLIGAGKEALDRVMAGFGHEPGAPPTPEMRAKAQKTGTEAVRKMAARADPTGEKLKFNKTEARGKPITAAEALGRGAETQLKVAGRRAGQTADALESQLRARHAETADRVVGDFEKLTGIDAEAAKGDFQSEMQRLRAKAAPDYERAYAHTDVESPVLTDLVKRPSMKKAMANARSIAQEEGRDPDELGLTTKKVPLMYQGKQLRSGQVADRGAPLFTDEEVEVSKPTMQTWDYVKRGLDDVIEGYRKNGKLELDTEGRAALKTLSALRGELTNEAQPWGSDYARALATGGEPLRQEEAFGAAKKLLSGTTSEADFKAQFTKFSPAQKDALKAGLVNHIRDMAMAGRTRMGELDTPLFKAKLQAVFGKDTAAELSERIADERFLMAHGQRMTPGIGSDTSETLLADKEQREAIADAARVVRKVGQGKWGEALLHAIGSPLVGAYRGAQMPMNEATRDVIGALLSKSPSELSKVLQAQGASPMQASHMTSLMNKAGLFTDKLRNAILARAGAAVGGAGSPPSAQTPAAGANDEADPFAQWAPKPAAPAVPAASSGPDVSMREPTAFTPDSEVSSYLESHLGVPIRITSSYRDEHRNQEVHGAKNSAHLKAEAWDFVPEGMDMQDAAVLLAQSGMPFDQIEITPTHVHVSFAPANRGQIIYGSS